MTPPLAIIQDIDKAIMVMRDVGKWLEESGRHPSKWWQLSNLNKEFLLQYAKKDEFYVALVHGEPAAAAILQIAQNGQEWKSVDGENAPQALYIHWLCVARKFAGQNVPSALVGFAAQKAQENTIHLLRVDTNAKELKLREIYEKLGFSLVTITKEDYRDTAFYQKEV